MDTTQIEVKKLQNGDAEALERLYVHLIPRTRKIVLRILGGDDIDAVNDNVNEAVLKIYSNLPKYDANKSGFWDWCSRITENIAKKRKSEDEALANLPNEPAFSPNLEIALEAREIIAQLPKAESEIILLWLNGFTPKELAERLGVSVSTVYRLLKRAQKRLIEERSADSKTKRRAEQ